MPKSFYFWIANAVTIAHVLFGLFCLFGWRYPELSPVHITALVLWIGSWLVLGYCPLTRLEFGLRKKYNPIVDVRAEIITTYIYNFFGIKLSHGVVVGSGLAVFLILLFLSIRF